MKKEYTKLNKIMASYSNTKKAPITKLILISFLSFVGISSSWAQVDCNLPMVCNDALQVSLETDCTATITADMMLETMPFLESDYAVTLKYVNGPAVLSNVVDGSHIGSTFEVRVSVIECSISCWGYITVEDKLAPTIGNCDDVTIDCSDSTEPGVDIPPLDFSDACGGQNTSAYIDSIDLRPCADEFAYLIYRTYFATDISGNTGSCQQIIAVRKQSLSDIVFPPNYDNKDQDAFECGELSPSQLEDTGAPTPEVTGYPTGISCSNIQYIKEDLIFNICGSSIKVLREWTVIDWCTGEDSVHAQVIKVLDTEAPEILDAEPIIYKTKTESNKCTGRFEVPAPNVSDCSSYSYVVGHKVKEPGDDPFLDIGYNKLSVNNGIWTIEILPLDTSYIVYTITDECGLVTQMYSLVVVEDMQKPSAVCEGFTVVSLNNLGEADLYATSVDDHSWDNCGIDSFAIKREVNNCNKPEDLEFGPRVDFCCNDTEVDYIMVTLRVFDVHGNFNDCLNRVRVQDKILPTITCPPDVEINCLEDKDDLTLTGDAVGFDNCGVTISHTDNLADLNDCGIGTVFRTFGARDQFGNVTPCEQEIEIKTEFIFTKDNIDFPGDIALPGCSSLDADPEGNAGKPEVMGEECMDIAISYTDQKYYDVDDYCIKIIRKWKVTDWCTFDIDNPIYITHQQIIKLSNSQAPIFVSGCDDITVSATNCISDVDLVAFASDDCTPDSKIKYRYEIDTNNDGDIDSQGTGNDASGIMVSGTHRVLFFALDECGNEGECSFLVTVRDGKAPTPVCYSEVVIVMKPEGTAEVWASDFDLKSFDGCSNEEMLRFSFTEDGNTPVEDFDCLDISNGVAVRIELTVFVLDESNNASSCNVTLRLQDNNNNNACTDAPNATAVIAGNIINEVNEGLQEVEVGLMNMSIQDQLKSSTDFNGHYDFSDIGYYNSYDLNPYKNDDILNGVSTLDLVMIQQHILGIRNIDSPYKLISADINGDGRISGSDIVEMRKVILGIYDNFKSNTSWRFIPSEYTFENPSNPWNYPQDIRLEELLLDKMDNDFIAVKIGDLNGTATANVKNRAISSRNNSVKTLEISTTKEENNIILTLSNKDVEAFIGMQFTLDFNQPIGIKAIKGASLRVDQDNFGFNRIGEGIVTFSYGNFAAVNTEGSDLFSIVLTNEIDIRKVAITSSVTKNETYTALEEVIELILENQIEVLPEENFKLFQNQPNPFNNQTNIKFYLTDEAQVAFRVFDLSGKEILHQQKLYPSGYNNISLDKSELPLQGIMYYQLQVGKNIATKKMIIMD